MKSIVMDSQMPKGTWLDCSGIHVLGCILVAWQVV